jgi:predicted RNase H-like nuclease
MDAHAGEGAVAFVDAPLLVLNPDRQRLCEKQVGQRYGRWKVSANSTNLGSPRLAGVSLRIALETLGWTYDDGCSGPRGGDRIVCECYPYTALVGASVLGYDIERPLYKRKPRSLTTAEWRPIRAAACDELVARLAALDEVSPSLDLRSHPVAERLLTERSPWADRDYKHREDLIDALVAAWTAALWHGHGLARCQVLGADDSLVDERGARPTIIAPARSEQRQGGRPPSGVRPQR